jgi:hypothetical protein
MIVFIIGACVHALVGAGVFFAKEEPHKAHIFVATMLKGLLVALLIGFSLKAGASPGIWTGAGHCLLYGLAFWCCCVFGEGKRISRRTRIYWAGASLPARRRPYLHSKREKFHYQPAAYICRSQCFLAVVQLARLGIRHTFY